MTLKPYTQIPIAECNQPLLPIPDHIPRVLPHAYQSLAAPYGERSPFWLRAGVIERLEIAIHQLRSHQLGLAVYDAYRPVEVQQFMVDHTFADLVQGMDLTPDLDLEPVWQQVYQFWAVPSWDLATPPPHSTGAAIDLALTDLAGYPLDLGSQIDQISPRSHPQFFAEHPDQDPGGIYAFYRDLLKQAMGNAGFCQHPNEWWHFSWGDQLWAWLSGAEQAIYGRA
ncbi:MAG: M15 family metallopeptidase [Pseudanabaenaceae cyanobacterium bins.68]|nr:M15 family metallopeptidase [Pseudanabaenaceae cyanobacterium bins.68]